MTDAGFTEAVLKSKTLEGCLGFRPEPVKEGRSVQSACLSPILNYFEQQNNQYNISIALSNILPDRAPFLGMWAYLRRKGLKVGCYRDYPSIALVHWTSTGKAVVCGHHYNSGPWRVAVGHDPLLEGIVFFNPTTPGLWEAESYARFDAEKNKNNIALVTTTFYKKPKVPATDTWVPGECKRDIWAATRWQNFQRMLSDRNNGGDIYAA